MRTDMFTKQHLKTSREIEQMRERAAVTRYKITIASQTPSGLQITDTIKFDGTFEQALKRAGQHRRLLDRSTTTSLTIKPMADRRAYQRDLMRKRREIEAEKRRAGAGIANLVGPRP
jgi:hypothetical protein